MEDNSRKEMVPLSENDLEEVSGGITASGYVFGAATIPMYKGAARHMGEKDEQSKDMVPLGATIE